MNKIDTWTWYANTLFYEQNEKRLFLFQFFFMKWHTYFLQKEKRENKIDVWISCFKTLKLLDSLIKTALKL